ncbi:MAG: amidohydrolase family protein [Actinobacteria bacterium]|nr:amidohydrolase family protein [Actinomycetota bacterium]
MTSWPLDGVVDPFVVLKTHPELADIPMARAALRDPDSLRAWPSTDLAGYLFRKDSDREAREAIAGDLAAWLDNLERHQVRQAQVPIAASAPDEVFDQLATCGDKVFLTVRMDPHEGMAGVRRLRSLAERYPAIRSVSLSPHQIYPFIAPDSREYYPVYAACVELELAVFINVGFPAARVPAFTQDPIHLDEVCWFFPELTVVMRHGGEPWVDTCVKMLLRWPNLYYATTAFAPRYYPQPIIDLLNTRGRDKVIWAGYWPALSYERLAKEVAALPVKDEAWPAFLRDNARRAFRLPSPQDAS